MKPKINQVQHFSTNATSFPVREMFTDALSGIHMSLLGSSVISLQLKIFLLITQDIIFPQKEKLRIIPTNQRPVTHKQVK